MVCLPVPVACLSLAPSAGAGRVLGVRGRVKSKKLWEDSIPPQHPACPPVPAPGAGRPQARERE